MLFRDEGKMRFFRVISAEYAGDLMYQDSVRHGLIRLPMSLYVY